MSEILGSLFKYLVALIAIAAVVVILHEVFGTNKVSTATQEVTTLQSNINQLYSGYANTTSISNTVAINSGAAPNDMNSGGTLIDPWGGDVTITGNAGGTDTVSIPQVPQKACTKLVKSISAFVSVSINGSSDSAPVDPATVATQCTSGSNKIAFTFNVT